MHRREFLIGAAAAAGLAATGSRGWAQGMSQQAKLDRIAIMTYSFGSLIKVPGQNDPARTLDPLDIPQMYVDRYGVRNIEFQHSHIHSTEQAYLEELKERMRRTGSRITQINLEFNVNMSAPEHYRRLEAVELTKRWIDLSVFLGNPRVMLNQGNLAPEVRPHAIEALRTMARYGDTKNVWVTLENRGQQGWEAVAEVVKAANSYTTPDIGNFPDQPTQHTGMRALFPMNRGNAHVKLRPERHDLAAAIALAKQLGYTGIYSIETTGNVDPDPYVGTQKILDVLLANI